MCVSTVWESRARIIYRTRRSGRIRWTSLCKRCWLGRKLVPVPVPCPLPPNLVDTAITVPELGVDSGTLVAIQVRKIKSSIRSTYCSKWTLTNGLINRTEAERVLPSPTTSSASPPSHLYYSHSWIPHNIEISLDKNGELSVRKVNGMTNESNNGASAPRTNLVMENGRDDNKIQIISEHVGDIHDDEECAANSNVAEVKSTNPEIPINTQKIQYSLSAVVCYVDDKTNEERRNIVALLQVGPNYHERLSGSAVSQWYIFNDFWLVFLWLSRKNGVTVCRVSMSFVRTCNDYLAAYRRWRRRKQCGLTSTGKYPACFITPRYLHPNRRHLSIHFPTTCSGKTSASLAAVALEASPLLHSHRTKCLKKVHLSLRKPSMWLSCSISYLVELKKLLFRCNSLRKMPY